MLFNILVYIIIIILFIAMILYIKNNYKEIKNNIINYRRINIRILIN